ncbi:MAG: COR domain-containing protein [Chloroflexota bacterium]
MANGNVIAFLPTNLRRLSKLNTLLLEKNLLTTLPEALLELTDLETLSVKRNPLPLPPSIIEDTKAQNILSYWQQYHASTAPTLKEAKLVLVGEGGVGKTSLVQQLTVGHHDVHEMPTRGIYVENWTLMVRNDEHKVNIWDFAGQEITHTTHQFFLTDDCLYLLVIDARRGEQGSRLSYWLQLLQTVAPNAPVLIVINRIDEEQTYLNQRGLRRKHPQIVDFVTTSAKTGQGIDELKQKIATAIQTLPHLQDPAPPSWSGIKEALRRRQKETDIISYADYQVICADNDIDEPKLQEQLLRYLHQVGVVLHFADNPLLKPVGILNPQWLVEGVYALITAPAVREQGGILYLDQFADLLSASRYPATHYWLFRDLLLEFDLAFPLAENPQKQFLIPGLLPENEPALPSLDETAPTVLRHLYQYPVLLPSLLPRFIVQHYRHIDGDRYWRSGCILAHGTLRVRLSADYNDHTIELLIWGTGNKVTLLSQLQRDFDNLHAHYPNLHPERYIPLPPPNTQRVRYEDLRLMQQHSIDQTIFAGLDAPISVSALLQGEVVPTTADLSLPQLRRLLNAHFDKEELADLIFDLEIDGNLIGGETVAGRIRELLGYVERNGSLPDLITHLRQTRPALLPS